MLLRLPSYLAFKSQINGSESLNFQSLKYNPSDNNKSNFIRWSMWPSF